MLLETLSFQWLPLLAVTSEGENTKYFKVRYPERLAQEALACGLPSDEAAFENLSTLIWNGERYDVLFGVVRRAALPE